MPQPDFAVSFLSRLVFSECQAIIGNDRVDAVVDRRRDELDPTPVGAADHPDARVALLVQQRLGLARDPASVVRLVADALWSGHRGHALARARFMSPLIDGLLGD